MTVLITGITGFVGSHLAKALVDRGYEVVGIVRDAKPRTVLSCLGYDKKVTLVRGDVLDLNLVLRVLAEYDVDFVYHLAAASTVGAAKRSPITALETNALGTATVLEACRINGSVKCVVASSDKVYGYQPEMLPYTEETPLKPVNVYDASKACADMMARVYHRVYGLPVAVTRFCNIYGFDLNTSRLVPSVIISVLRGERPVIRSDGMQVREYMYVEDCVDAYLRVMERFEHFEGKAVNVGTGEKYAVLEVVDKILSLMNAEVKPIILNQARDEIKAQYMVSEVFKVAARWRPRYTMDEGLKLTIDEYKRWFRGEGV